MLYDELYPVTGSTRLTAAGETHSIQVWSRHTKLSVQVIKARLLSGCDAEQALGFAVLPWNEVQS